MRSRALTALILNLLSVVLCCGVVGIAGAVVSGVAVGQVDRNPADARRMLTWAWILLAGSVVSGVLLGTFLAVVGLGSRTAGPGFACWGENNSCP